MYKVKRRWMKKWMLTYSSQLGKLWIGLLLLLLLRVALQIVEKLQCSSNCSCGLKRMQLSLQESTANNNSFWDGKGPVLSHRLEPVQKRTPNLLPHESIFAEKNNHVIKLSNAFNKIKLLDARLGSEDEFLHKKTVAPTKGMRILHAPNEWKHGTQNVPVGDQASPSVIFPDSRKPIAAIKAGTSSDQVSTGIAVDEPSPIVEDPLQNQTQASPSSNPKNGISFRGTIMAKSQTTGTLKGKRPIMTASTKLGSSRPPPPEKVALPNTVSISKASLSQGTMCKPKTHIVFLKVHKSASSTVMNVLFRFGETHNLTFAFPSNGASQLYYPDYFTAAVVEGFSPGKESKFNIMCHHMRFFRPEEPSALFHCAPVWLESTSSSRDTPGTCTDFPTISATATAGQCFVRGGAWVSP